MSREGVPQLRVRSSYSLAQGASPVSALVSRAAELGLPAMALCDHHNLYGTLEFSKYALGKGVQPIMGMRARLVHPGGRGGWVTLLAQTEQGFANLSAMLRAVGPAPQGSVERKLAGDSPRLPRDILSQRGGGVLCLWGGGEDGQMSLLPAGEGEEEADFLLGLFGDRLYAEVCRTSESPSGKGRAAEERQLALARAKGIPLVGTWDTWYATPDRHKAWVLLGAMSAEPRREVLVSDEGLVEGGNPVHAIPSGDEFRHAFRDLPEAVRNAFSVARRCAFAVEERAPLLPPFACGEGRTEAEELRRMAREGLEARLDAKGLSEAERPIYKTRLEFELSVIERMGFPGYFLIVADFIQWAKGQGIPVGPGRGSGAGSVVAWALTITDLDPLEFGLLFERFLNPDRVSMPDFDIDFCEDRRDEVIRYVREKYGEEKVAYIATFGVIRGKTALRDAHRVLRHDKLGAAGLRDIDRVSKLIPKKEDAAEPMGLDEAHEKVPEFRDAVSPASAPTIAMAFEMAREVEGLMKSRGLHAAGVVIADRPLDELVPVVTDEKTGASVTGYSLKGAEAAGLVKFDFLGLTTLSILEEARRHVMATCGYALDLATLPRDDPEVMAGLAKGDALGVFQFETGGMRQVLRQVKVSTLEDLIAVVALFRPGPMAYIETYAERKNGRMDVEYPAPVKRTEPILRETFGIMVYQEQVMQVAQACAGYALGEADLLRRAMGKKIKAEMDKQRVLFVKGAVAGWSEVEMADGSVWEVHSLLRMRLKQDPSTRLTIREMTEQGLEPDPSDFLASATRTRPARPGEEQSLVPSRARSLNDGLTEEEASHLFDDIANFANYGFNKSHAAAYAWISYQTAWMRHRFPVEFYAATMTYCRTPEKRGVMKDDMTRHGVELLPPDINRSRRRFVPERHGAGLAVRYGFCGIKGLPEDIGWLEEEREARGPFRSMRDFHARVGKRLNKDHLQLLAAMGAFSSMVPVRAQAADILAQLDAEGGRSSDLFGERADPRSDVGEWPDLPEREFKAAGFYMSGHPLDYHAEILAGQAVLTREQYRRLMLREREERLGNRFLLLLVKDVQAKQSKKGTTFLQVTVMDREETFQMNCFSRGDQGEFAEFNAVLRQAKADGTPLVVDCDLSLSQDGERVWVNGNSAVTFAEFETLMDTSRDALLVRLSLPEGCTAERRLSEALPVAERAVAAARSEDPSRSVELRLACDGETRTLPGRYGMHLARQLLLAALPGVLGVNYLAENA